MGQIAPKRWGIGLGLRTKLVLPLAILAMFAATFGTLALRSLETRRVERELIAFCRAIAESIADVAELTDDPQNLQRFVASAATGPGVEEIVVASGEPLTIVAASRLEWVGRRISQLPMSEHCLEGLEWAAATGNPSSDLEHGNLHLVGYTLPIRTLVGASDSLNLASGAVMVHLDHRPTRDAARTTSVAILAGLVTTILGGAIGSYALLKWLVLQPVAAIGRVVDAQAAGDVTARICNHRGDELGQLARQFDSMLDALASSHAELVREHDVQRQLAHELSVQNAELTEKRNALEQAEAKFRSLVNNIPGVSYRCLMDGSWTMLFVSDAVEELTGYAPADFLHNAKRTFESVIHEEEREMVAREIAVAVARHKSYTLEYRIVHALGDVRWVREKGQAIFLAPNDSVPAYLDGAIFDITDRKISEEALSHERQRLENVIEGTSAGTWEWNIATGETAFNERWAQIVGYSLEELGPISIQTWESLVHPEDRRRSEELLKDCFSGRTDGYSCECRMRHKSGDWVWVHDRGKIVQWTTDGRPLRMAGTHIDITARKQTERTLRDAMQQLESHKFAIDEHAIVAVTDPRGTITYANDRFCEISGYSREDLIGQDHRLLNSGEHPKSFWRNMWRTISQGRVWHGEICNRSKAGSLYWVDATIVPFKDVGGRVTQYIAIRTDITRIKEIQRELELKSLELAQAWEKAEAASNAKSEFLANMSHEIRTPLTAMLGYADLLAEEGDVAETLGRRHQTVDTIKRAGEHLLSVVNDILDVSKVDAGMMTVEHIETDLPELFQGVESLLRPRAEGKGISLDVRFDTPIPTKVLSDPTRLRQVLMNLIGNAIKFTESGGVRLSVGIERQGDKLLLRAAVVDTGSGLTPEQASHLFRAFSQADSSVTRKHGGTGLGLMLCRRLTGLMGGSVELIHTAPGRGSTFTATFRVEPVPHAAAVTSFDQVGLEVATTKSKEISSLSGRILLAEDGPDNQRLIALILRKAGAQVDVAENGKIALQLLDRAETASQPYDLLLTDIQMPEMDGYTLTRRLRDRGSTIGIVALTAHAMPEDRQRCLAAGCNDYTTKPIEKSCLLATCSRWLASAVSG